MTYIYCGEVETFDELAQVFVQTVERRQLALLKLALADHVVAEHDIAIDDGWQVRCAGCGDVGVETRDGLCGECALVEIVRLIPIRYIPSQTIHLAPTGSDGLRSFVTLCGARIEVREKWEERDGAADCPICVQAQLHQV